MQSMVCPTPTELREGVSAHAGHGLSYADIYKRSLICLVEQPTCLLQVRPAKRALFEAPAFTVLPSALSKPLL